MDEKPFIDDAIEAKHVPKLLRLIDANRGKWPLLSATLKDDKIVVMCGVRGGRMSGYGLRLVFGKVDRKVRLLERDFWLS